MNVLKNITIYTGETMIENGFIRFDRVIHECGPMGQFIAQADDRIIETDAATVIPGFIDVHSHGGYSYDSMDASPEEIDQMVRRMTKEEGITTYFCTTMTQSIEAIDHAMENIRLAAEKNPVIRGIHLEGPFINPVFKGAQKEDYILKPDIKLLSHWNELSGGLIRIVTYAPENADPDFESFCRAQGIVLSAGHSNAVYEELRKSAASHVTHLYNAQRGLKHREPGVTGYGMLTDGVTTELICDGIHIMPDMIRMAYLLKGSKGIECITDSMRAKGMPDGVSELGGQTVYVKDHTARLADGTIAGSVLTYIRAFRNIMAFTGCSIHDAVQMTSVNQAREFGLAGKGAVRVGCDADFVLLQKDLELAGVISAGNLQ